MFGRACNPRISIGKTRERMRGDEVLMECTSLDY